MSKQIAILPGDGIGLEIAAQAVLVLQTLKSIGLNISWQQADIGGRAYDNFKHPLPESTLELAAASDAVLLGAVGGPKYEKLPRELRPERGLLAIRQQLNLFSNLRPAILYPQLAAASSLKSALVANLDIMIVRELTGGIYFGEPRGIETQNGIKSGYNTLRYSEQEIERIAHSAFKIAAMRRGKLCSVDKANVLEVSELWREIVDDVARQYPQVAVSHMYVDNAAMQLVKAPKQFDVIVTGNLFGDILSDIAAMLTGSIGMLPSASLDANNKGMYEPVHGSAPDIAGEDKANPLAMILSIAMLLRYSFAEQEYAALLEDAVAAVLAAGYRTLDIAPNGAKTVGTKAMGEAVVAALQKLADGK